MKTLFRKPLGWVALVSANAVGVPVALGAAPRAGGLGGAMGSAGVDFELWTWLAVAVAQGVAAIAAVAVFVLYRRTNARAAAAATRMQSLLTQVDCLLWEAEVLRVDGRLQWVFTVQPSGLYRRLFGQRPVTREGGLWSHLHIPEQSEMDARAQQAIESGAPGYEQEFRVIQPQATYWLAESVSIVAAGPGVAKLVGVVTDVTPRHQAEEAEERAAAGFRELIEHAPVAILQADFTALKTWLDGLRAQGSGDLSRTFETHPKALLRALAKVRVLEANDVTLRLFRVGSKPELLRRRGRLLRREGLPALRGGLLALARGQNTFEVDSVFRDARGAALQLHLRCWMPKGEQGLDFAQVVVVLVDMTDLRRAEAELATEKERLAVTLRAMAEAVVTTDTAGVVQFVNPAATQLLQQSSDTAVGRPLAEICALEEGPAGRPLTLPVARVLEGAGAIELPAGTRLLVGSTGPRQVEGCCTPIQATDRGPIGMVLVLRDVTERERLEAELVRTSKLESVGLLAGGIAHDFNNILTVVLGNVTMARLGAEPASKNARVLQAAEQAVLRARDLTQQLLTFARGGDPLRAAVRLPQVIAEAVQFALHGSAVRSELALVPDLWPADADKGQIGRVVQNLVLHAVEAMPGGGTVRIAASNERVREADAKALPAGDYVRISVTDRGPGLKPADLGRVFEPYFTLSQGGRGLGLATAHSIVRKHQGRMEVESTLGHGTTFHVWLPALRDRVPLDSALPPVPAGRLNVRVLFMDDEVPIREMATDMMEWLGCEGVMAANGQEAVNLFRMARAQGRPFEVVVMDLTIPGGMGGVETLELLRTMDPQVKVIVSSGYSSDPIMAGYREHGFAGRVAKPYDVTEFARVLCEVLGAADASASPPSAG